MPSVGIIGGGHAGVSLAQSLRRNGYTGSIDIFERSSYRPYERPALSKEALEDDLDDDDIRLISDQTLHSEKIFLNLESEVKHIASSEAGFEISLGIGETLSYDNLVLATGVTPRRLDLETNPKTPVCYLQSYEDLLGLRMHISPQKRVLIIGAGFIGLEVASSLRSQGVEVTVLERTSQVMNGTNLILDAGIENTHFSPSSAETEFTLSNSEVVIADLVLVAIGVVPKTDILSVDVERDGDHILVDEEGRTNIPGLYAIGDVAARPAPHDTSQPAKIQSVDAANYSAERLASILTGGSGEAYSSWLPRFWSNQVGHKLQIAGLASQASPKTLRGSYETDSFLVGYFDESKLVAVESVNAPKDFNSARKLILTSDDLGRYRNVTLLVVPQYE
jgi:3-phenylpropionate/trans-cinnamate dioxygenase ferredoxin reductase subunit